MEKIACMVSFGLGVFCPTFFMTIPHILKMTQIEPGTTDEIIYQYMSNLILDSNLVYYDKLVSFAKIVLNYKYVFD